MQWQRRRTSACFSRGYAGWPGTASIPEGAFLWACRRNGKPTSLGCFDHEEQAARAYDKMMLWCELHNTSGVKGGGITNFDPTEYEKDLAWLQTITQVRAARPFGDNP